MLTHINIRNFTIADEVEVEFSTGMTALTGETGAGKSILIDALGLALGDRADSGLIRHGCERAEITVEFDLAGHGEALRWLQAHELDADDVCQLRRVITREGRSRAFINNQPVPNQALRKLGEQLVDIHGQHEHQSLRHASVQRRLLDGFAGHEARLARVAGLYGEWQSVRDELESISPPGADRDAHSALQRYQLAELQEQGLAGLDIGELGREHDRLAHAGELLTGTRQALETLNAEAGPSVYGTLGRLLNELQDLARLDGSLAAVTGMLQEIQVLVQECSSELRRYGEHLEIEPGTLRHLEERIGTLHDLARKHRCKPEDLPAVQERLQQELATLEETDARREALQARLDELASRYREAATQLSGSRKQAARRFARLVSADLHLLGMPGAVFEAAIQHDGGRPFGPHGLDRIEFRVSTNPGQPAAALSRVASGGELSRISLAIQAICLEGEHIPTLIFDEVDSGIGGSVAENVGRKLRTLGNGRQVFCVTHLPQVAALAGQQIQVSKVTRDNNTRTLVRRLEPEQRIDELARMLGGVKITRQTLEHAREMLEQARAPQGKARAAERRDARRVPVQDSGSLPQRSGRIPKQP